MSPTPLRTSHETQPALFFSLPIEYAAERDLFANRLATALPKTAAQPNANRAATTRKATFPSTIAPP